MNHPPITIYTQVYNAAPYLEQCVSSVLTQTYENFEYLILDNGSTDESKNILERMADADARIQLIRTETNVPTHRLHEFFDLTGKQGYLTELDSDDWWDPHYLESMVAFAEKNRLDIACTGTVMTMEGRIQHIRKVDKPLLLSRSQFAAALPAYHVFFRPIWGKLFRMQCVQSVSDTLHSTLMYYGADTVYCFQLLRHVARIGIDASTLHYYRLHKKSVSYQYFPQRFDSDIFLYHDAINFLTMFGPVSTQNRQFLQIVYANAVYDTLGVIGSAKLTPSEKLKELVRIATHPITLTTYRQNTNDAVKRSRNMLLQLTLQAGVDLKETDNDDLRRIVQTLLPCCGQIVTGQSLPVIVNDPTLFEALLMDKPEPVLTNLLKRIETEHHHKKKDCLARMIQLLAVDNPLLCQLHHAGFLSCYHTLYLSIWRGEQMSALEEMTGLLLEHRVTEEKEMFLNLYISLAAVLGQENAFVFGKFQLARFLLEKKRIVECWEMVSELQEMGLTGSDELTEICQVLEQKRRE